MFMARCLKSRDVINHLWYVFNTQRWVSDMAIVIIPREISIMPPQIPPDLQRQNTRGTFAFGEPE
ncbi:hypothetical protein E2C01_041478 [Portunus trituberculatus]|uniref:Uncharacterized protein n=1 Tax=Portunus trituberculatus TaxID=210409 RepID=A0A5B7FRT6_PORTR|nr:hypothetical protein [Portunus trituberculatus]